MSIAEKLTAIAENEQKVFDAGMQKEWSDFWDAYQDNGKRTDYKHAFSYTGWTVNSFRPKYDIKPTGANGVYLFHGGGAKSAYNLEAVLERQGVVLDLSGMTTSNREFYLSRFTRLPTLDFSGCATMTNTFDYYAGHSPIRLILSDSGETTFSSIFNRVYYVTTVEIVSGVIGKSISFSSMPLSVESMKNIIEHLKDYSGTDSEYNYTVTFSTSAFEGLEASGIAAPSGSTWAEYIDDLKWNLTLA